MIKEFLDKLSTTTKVATLTVALLTALATMVGWGTGFYGNLVTQVEASELEQELSNKHDQDIQAVLQELADEKKIARVQENHTRLNDLNRDLIGGRYANEQEKQLIIYEIGKIQDTLLCDEQGVCNN